MSKKFAVFDIDGTLFRSGLYREVVYELINQNVISDDILDDFADQETAWQKRAHGSAFKEFDQAMVDALENVITDLKVSDYNKAVKSVIKNHKDNVYVYTRDLAKELKDKGFFMIAISGSQTELVEPFAKYYNFDVWVGQYYERKKGYFTGKAVKTHKNKHVILSDLIEQFDLSLSGSVGVGDSGGDITLLDMVENPIAFNPEDRLFKAAKTNKWKIVLERKNMIYELEYDSKIKSHRLYSVDTH